MIYSAADRVRAPVAEAAEPRRARPLADGRRQAVILGPAARRSGAAASATSCSTTQRVAPPRRDPAAGRRLVVEDLGSTNGVKRQRAGHRGRHAARTPATASSWGRRRVTLRARVAHPRAATMLEPVSVALKFGFLAVLYLFLLWVARSALKDLRRPGVETIQRPGSRSRLRRRRDRAALRRARARRRSRRPDPAAASSSGRPATSRRGVRPRATSAMLGRGDRAPRSSSRTRSPPRATPHRAPGVVVVLEDLGSTNGTYLNGSRWRARGRCTRATGSGSATRSSPTRPDAARRRALREHRHRPPAPGQRGRLLRALAAVRRRRRHGRRAGGRGRLARRRRGLRSRACPTAGPPRSGSPRASARRTTRIHAARRGRRARAGMGTTLTAVYVGEREVAIAHVGDSRAYRLPRRRARRGSPRTTRSSRSASPRASSPQGGRGAPAALDHHPRARPRARASRSTRAPARRAPATCSCSAATG